MEIEEIIFSKEGIINTPDPYMLSAKIFDMAFQLGEVVEKRNTFMTDGPVKKSVMEFDIVRHYDDYSKFVISVMLDGETNFRSALEIELTGTVKTKIEDRGFFSSVFAEFYLENIYQNVTERAKSEIHKAQKHLEKNIELMASKK